VSDDLPDARKDGVCCDCGKRPAVTRDGRFCRPCLGKFVRHLNPMVGCYVGMLRTPGHRQASSDDAGPWGENAIRVMEDWP